MSQQKGIFGAIALIIVGLFLMNMYNNNQKNNKSINYEDKIKTSYGRIDVIDAKLDFLEGTPAEIKAGRKLLIDQKNKEMEKIAKWEKHEDATDVALIEPKAKAPVTPGQPKPATKSGEKADNLKKLGGF